MTEPNRYFFGLDFDKTIAATFNPSPNNLGAQEVHALAIGNIFGEHGSHVYEEVLGGLQNRAPSELIHLLLSNDQDGELRSNAGNFVNTNLTTLSGFVPVGKGVNIDDLTLREPTDVDFTEVFVREKLRVLMAEIGQSFPDGKKWPVPCTGFLEFWQTINDLNNKGDVHIDTAIISSGHERFIEKTFNSWGINLPSYLVTEDDMRGKAYPSLERRVKPGTYPLTLAHKHWLKDMGLKGSGFDMDKIAMSKQRMVYFGDDAKKDGGMAQRSGVLFGWFNEGYRQPNQSLVYGFSFDNWQVPSNILVNKQNAMVNGSPMSSIYIPC